MGNIVDKGPSVFFIKDLDGHIFGGFAAVSWTIGPQFKGIKKRTYNVYQENLIFFLILLPTFFRYN